jgi:hypothetical protein
MWEDFAIFVGVGVLAQLSDGAIGMAYGVVTTTVLLSLGIAPATASASVHAAEVFTTAASGFSHWRLGNVDWSLIKRLAIPGMIGGAIGAYVLTSIPGEAIRPFISAYLLLMGAVILWKAANHRPPGSGTLRHVAPLGLCGGFLDAVGGGGWGPLVTSTLIGRGAIPRFAIGSVNLTEFSVTATISATFIATIGLELWPIIGGLVVGGVVAAPFAAYTVRRIPARPMMFIVASVVIVVSVRGLYRSLA